MLEAGSGKLKPKGLGASLTVNPQQAEMYRSQISLGYFGDSENDIGPVALFLASDDARYITGQTINADGGMIML